MHPSPFFVCLVKKRPVKKGEQIMNAALRCSMEAYCKKYGIPRVIFKEFEMAKPKFEKGYYRFLDSDNIAIEIKCSDKKGTHITWIGIEDMNL